MSPVGGVGFRPAKLANPKGASYHRSAEFKDFLDKINKGLNEDEWKVTCIRFAPNDPTQNPVEDIWLYAKKFVREFYHLCKSFSNVKRLFEFVTHHQIFDFPKMFMYDPIFYNYSHLNPD